MQTQALTQVRIAVTSVLAAILCAGPFVSAWADEAISATETGVGAEEHPATGSMLVADKLLVRKTERRLYLMRQGRVLREYRVALGTRGSRGQG